MVRIGEQYLLGLQHYVETHMLISFIPQKNKITVDHDSVFSVAQILCLQIEAYFPR